MKDRQSLGDTPPEEFRRQLHELADWIADFRENIETLRVAPDDKPGAIGARFAQHPPEEGERFEKILSDVYFGWTTTAPGILGEIISAPLNINAMTWRTSPAATELETLVIDWIRQWVDLPKEFDGVVYDTASVGILHALAVAREEAAPFARTRGLAGRADLPRFRIYTSDQAHNAAEKAAIALGIGEENVRRVPCDSEFRMEMSILRKMIAADRQSGFKPMAVIATAGTTSTASVDPIVELACLRHEEKVWLHIDAAYGGGFAILPEYKWITEGWSNADSIIINPHKSLFVPLDFSVLYMCDLERLRRVFTLAPPDVLRGDTVEATKNYMDYGVQLGRRFRALKAWIIFRSFGREGMAARLREHIRLANLFADWIRNDDRFELAAPAAGRLDRLNSEIVERINASGRAYLTQTKLRGRTLMRIGLGNVLTTEEHLRKAWEIIQETASKL